MRSQAATIAAAQGRAAEILSRRWRPLRTRRPSAWRRRCAAFGFGFGQVAVEGELPQPASRAEAVSAAASQARFCAR